MQHQEHFAGLSGISPRDQTIVSRFGCGPTLTVPHNLVHEAFEKIADCHPTAIAAKSGERKITYQQLDIAANRLAHHLVELGLQPKQRVCLVVQRSIEMLIGIFAILKAGCQYVPVDGGVASEKALNHIFTDTAARFILCLPKFSEKVQKFASNNSVIVTIDMDVGASQSDKRPRIHTSSTDGAYCIYTSGKS